MRISDSSLVSYGRGGGLGRCRGVDRGRGVALGVTLGVPVGVAVAVAVGVGVGVPPPVTVRVTGTATSGRTGSLLPTQTLAWCVPTVSLLASISTVTSWLLLGGMLPEAGLSEIQGTSVGGTQGAPEAIARAVCWFPWINWPTMFASPVVVLSV
jgi:hypothetical protein